MLIIPRKPRIFQHDTDGRAIRQVLGQLKTGGEPDACFR